MTSIDLSRVKKAITHAGSLVAMLGDLRKQLASLELGDLLRGQRRSPLGAAAWFGAGVVTGAAAAAVLAPKSGEQLRGDIARSAKQLKAELARRWQQRGRAPNEREATVSGGGFGDVHPIHS